jgi:tRNA (adenine22-N1)-methyltransferase
VKKLGAPRRALLVAMCPPGGIIVDVGADHGHVAAALGAIATERMPHRAGRQDLRWVIADGLRPFRHVDTAIIAGMGWKLIREILEAGPRPTTAVLHAADDPGALRAWLASHGWRIQAEALAPEARRFATVLRAVAGQEEATGLALEFGPRLIESGTDPHYRAHIAQLHGYWSQLARTTEHAAPAVHERAAKRARYLAGLGGR